MNQSFCWIPYKTANLADPCDVSVSWPEDHYNVAHVLKGWAIDSPNFLAINCLMYYVMVIAGKCSELFLFDTLNVYFLIVVIFLLITTC